jgi:hypothetical protein
MNFWQHVLSYWQGNRYEVERSNLFSLQELDYLKGESKILPFNPHKWYKENPFVFAAINERAKAVSNAKFYIKTEDGELIENELTDKLNSPNQYQSKEDFFKQLATFQGIFGTGYIYLNKLRPSKPIAETEIITFESDKVDFDELKDVDFTANQLKFVKAEPKIYYKGKQERLLLDVNGLLPVFDTATFTNPYMSESRLKNLQLAVSNIQSAMESQNTFLSTPGGIGMLVKRVANDGMSNPVLTPDERKEIELDLQQKHGTLLNQRNFQVVGAPVDFISTMADVKKLELNPTIIQNALIIFGAFDIPKELLAALASGSTFENQKESYKRYIQTAAQELANNYARTIGTAIPSPEGELIADFSHLPIMQEDEKLRADVNKIEADTNKINKEIYDDWLSRGIITDQQYREFFKL